MCSYRAWLALSKGFLSSIGSLVMYGFFIGHGSLNLLVSLLCVTRFYHRLHLHTSSLPILVYSEKTARSYMWVLQYPSSLSLSWFSLFLWLALLFRFRSCIGSLQLSGILLRDDSLHFYGILARIGSLAVSVFI